MRHSVHSVLTLLVILILAGSASAAGSARFGLGGNLGWATMWGNEAGDTGNRGSYSAEAFLLVPLSDQVSLRTGAGYGIRGSFQYFPLLDADVDLQLTYLDIPALLQIDFPSSAGSVSPFLFFGSVLSLNLGATATVTPYTGNSGPVDVDVANVKSNDLSLLGGFGLAFGRGETQFFVDARYQLGLGPIFDNISEQDVVTAINAQELPFGWANSDGSVTGFEWNNAVLSFTAGLRF